MKWSEIQNMKEFPGILALGFIQEYVFLQKTPFKERLRERLMYNLINISLHLIRKQYTPLVYDGI